MNEAILDRTDRTSGVLTASDGRRAFHDFNF
jgi:hypothetical protein